MHLEGTDLQRRSRHIDIKVNWLRELLAKEILQIAWRRGAWLGKDMADTDLISTDGQCVICTKTDRKINDQWDSDHVLGMTDGPINLVGHRQVKAEQKIIALKAPVLQEVDEEAEAVRDQVLSDGYSASEPSVQVGDWENVGLDDVSDVEAQQMRSDQGGAVSPSIFESSRHSYCINSKW